jgi:hypothetical protein
MASSMRVVPVRGHGGIQIVAVEGVSHTARRQKQSAQLWLAMNGSHLVLNIP